MTSQLLLYLRISLALNLADEAALDDADLLVERLLEIYIIVEVLAVAGIKSFGEVQGFKAVVDLFIKVGALLAH